MNNDRWTCISGRPAPLLNHIFTHRDDHKPVFPLDQQRCYYFFSARYALSAGIKASGIGSDDIVLLPSYNCWTEIDPFIHAKIKPVYYKIKKNLDIDFDDLLSKITNKVKAILVTHFLGFPQPIGEIKKICEDRNLILIEDCAHAFLSTYNDTFLGSYGDFSIFSLMKTLPVPNGGVLLINNKNIKYRHNVINPKIFPTFFYLAELLKRGTVNVNGLIKNHVKKIFYHGLHLCLTSQRLFLAGFRKLVNQNGIYLVRPDSYLFLQNLCSWGISDISKNIISRMNFEEIKNKRRRNFEYVLNHFLKNEKGLLPFGELPAGVCPLFFPIIIESAEKRERLYAVLKKKGIVTHPWWNRFHPDVPWDQFPDAVYLKQRLFGLPIHQDLTFKHLDCIINAFEDLYHGKGMGVSV